VPLDADAALLLEHFKAHVPMPKAGTDVVAYRKSVRFEDTQTDVPFIARVETFAIDGPEGEPLEVRYYCADTRATTQPTVLFFHGGGFITCNLDTHDGLCRRLARDSRWAFLSVDYRLAPEHPFPAALDDAYAALRWAASSKGRALGIDPERIVVAGDSAGGNIAAALALKARDLQGPAILHQVLIYPVLDHDFDTPSYRENGRDYFLTEESMRWYWKQYLGVGGSSEDGLAAPGRAVDLAGLPPATVLAAGYDPLRDEAKAYADRLQAAAVRTLYRCYPGTFHGFISLDTLQSCTEARALIVQRLTELGFDRQAEMSSHHNRSPLATYEEWVRSYNAHDKAANHAVLDPGFKRYARSTDWEPMQIGPYKATFVPWFRAFPDCYWETLQAFEEGEWVAARARETGSFIHPYEYRRGQVLRPTGRSYVNYYSIFMKVRNGLITEYHYYEDPSWPAQVGIDIPQKDFKLEY
jgi:acetyl esterase